MILPATRFKARLIEIPRIRKSKDSKEFVEYGKFTLKKKYPVYSIYSSEKNTQFLVTDDTGHFIWIDTAAFKK